jgi:hypothetical protein
MTSKKISALVAAALLVCGIGGIWAFAQAPKHTPLVNAAAAPVDAAAFGPPLPAASANTVAAGPSPQDCALPARPKKPHAKPKIYRPKPALAQVAAEPLPPPPIYSQPVYSPPVVMVIPPPVVVGGITPYYGYGRYPSASLSYYHPHAPRYWAYGGSRFVYGGSYGGGWPRGYASVAR